MLLIRIFLTTNFGETAVKDDPAIKRIRDVRHQISKEHGSDPKRIVGYYMEPQRKRQEQACIVDLANGIKGNISPQTGRAL